MSKAVPNTTNFNINRFSPIFQRYLINRLQDKDWSGRYLASIAGCDEGHISHIRRLGHIPRRDLVAAIGRALGDEDCCLLAAGYLPRPGLTDLVFIPLDVLQQRRTGDVVCDSWWLYRPGHGLGFYNNGEDYVPQCNESERIARKLLGGEYSDEELLFVEVAYLGYNNGRNLAIRWRENF